MKIPSPTARRRPRIEIIPLIDIMCFLLATFVMVSLSMIKNRGIPVRLPAAVSGVAHERRAAVAITVTERGDLYLEKEAVTPQTLASRLERMKQTTPDLRVVIHGDERAAFGRVAHVLDDVRAHGITKVTIQVRTASAQPS